MGTWAQWLLGLAAPVAKRVLAAVGLGVVSYAGAEVALTAALNAVQTALGGLGGEVAALLAIGGFFQALSILAGGMMASLAWATVGKIGRVGG